VRAQPARAGCGVAGRPWVSVAFGGPHWSSELSSVVLADLRAGLRLKGIDACVLGTPGNEPPLALLQLQAAEPERVSVGIEVHDALTEKRVLRDLDLREVSADARALAIAAAADELLRASWAELALHDAPEPARPPPLEVEQTLQGSIEPARIGGRDHALGARAALENHGVGLSQFGVDAYIGVWFAERLGIELGAGMREGFARSAEHGSVSARALRSHLDLMIALLPRDRTLGLSGTLGLALASVRVRGAARAGGSASEGAGIALHARGGFALGVTPWPAWALRADIGAGVPLRSVEATDAGKVVLSSAGLELHVGLGTELRF
jgi:hypothetical protein